MSLQRNGSSGPDILAQQPSGIPFPVKRGECVMCHQACPPTVWICDGCRPEANRLQREAEEQVWQRRFAESLRAARASVPRRFAGMTFEHEHLRGIARSDIEEIRRATGDVTLIGKSGEYKTKAAVSLFHHHLAEGEKAPRSPAGSLARFARFALAIEVSKTRLYGEAPRAFGVDAPEILEADKASLLVLDDVGSEGRDAARIEVISEIFQIRHQEGRRTIATTGLYPDEVARRYGACVARRMFDEREVTVIWLNHEEKAAYLEEMREPQDGGSR